MDEDSITKQKTRQVYSFWKINVFRLHLNDSREGFSQRGRGRSFHVDGPKTGGGGGWGGGANKKKNKKKRELTVLTESGARNLEAENIRSRIHSTSL